MSKKNKLLLKDISKEANVSISTVSRYFNKESIKDSSKIKIESALKDNNWSIEINQSKNNIKNIGLILPNITHNYLLKIAESIIMKAKEYNYIISIASSESNTVIEKEHLEIFSKASIDGLIYIPVSTKNRELVNELKYFNDKPLVIACRRSILKNKPHIYADNIEGGYMVTKYMLGLGRTKIGFIIGLWEYQFSLEELLELVKDHDASGCFPSIDRFKGYLKALKEAGIEYDPTLTIVSHWGFEGGRSAAVELILKSTQLDGIIAASDTMAAGAIDTLKCYGIKIPDDISVIGWDNNQISNFTNPKITTVEQSSKNIGFTALSTIHSIIAGKEVSDSVYGVSIIQRESTSFKKNT